MQIKTNPFLSLWLGKTPNVVGAAPRRRQNPILRQANKTLADALSAKMKPTSARKARKKSALSSR